jgi:cell division protein FtsB
MEISVEKLLQLYGKSQVEVALLQEEVGQLTARVAELETQAKEESL